ncbi:hypothetical protein BvCmsB5655_03692 [Escherichia coli]|nr:hypothetical protein BvCmsB5655_03692 [Escherichia coli]
MRTVFFIWSLFSLAVLTVCGICFLSSINTWYINLLFPFVCVGLGFTLHSVCKDYNENK